MAFFAGAGDLPRAGDFPLAGVDLLAGEGERLSFSGELAAFTGDAFFGDVFFGMDCGSVSGAE